MSRTMHESREQAELCDEDFLDLVFERALDAVEAGETLDVVALLAEREHLRLDVERLVETARITACAPRDPTPQVPGYSVVEELGRGGMGTVHLARQEALGGRLVALKFLPADSAASGRWRKRFLAEARALASVRHPSVVAVYDVIDAPRHCAYAMEWIDGPTLGQLIAHVEQRSAGRAPNAAALRELLQLDVPSYAAFVARVGVCVARALAELHRSGLIHRDVKPSNVLLRRDGTALLSDFGLAHASDESLTKSGEFVGTVAYASPEQLEGEPESLDARSDVYALGVTLYHALALHLPFDAPRGRARRSSTPTGMLRLIESRSAVALRRWNPDAPRDLETIVAKAMEPDPAARYASADELAEDLERLLSLRPIRARRAGPIARAIKFVRRHRAGAVSAIAGSAFSLALAASIVTYMFLVPGWVAEHVREARLALLDPGQANAVFVRELWGQPSSESGIGHRSEALRAALEHYDRALFWSPGADELRDERNTIADVLEGTSRATDRGPRCAGLAAFVAGDIDGALGAWNAWTEARDPLAETDPLVEAALGVLYLVRDEHARAYPRLREAVRQLPDVGFLTVYLADAAQRCGDFVPAERLLEASRVMARLDPNQSRERVLADLYAATGRTDRAEALYAQAAADSPFALHQARFLRARGRVEEALDSYVKLAGALHGPRVQREVADALDAWWTGLTLAQRRERVSRALDEPPTAVSSFVARLRARSQAARRLAEHGAIERGFGSSLSTDIRRGSSSSPIESLGLPELAERLETENMALWNWITSNPTDFKQLQLAAWRSPWPRAASLVVRALMLAAAPVGALSVASDTALAQSCPPARAASGMSWDSARDVAVLFGGFDTTSELGDTWEWDGSSWTQRFVAGPSARHGFTAMPYDSARGVSVLFGGETLDPGINHWSDETWEWNGTSWTQRLVSGPSRRHYHGIAYDSTRAVTVLFGGFGFGGHFGDTWEWNGTVWTQRNPSNAPSPRMVGGMAYDSARGVTVLFGGYLNNGSVLGDTWEWDGTNWTQRTSAHAPSARSFSAMDFDSVRSRVVLFGGWDQSTAVADTWEWDGTDWTLVANGRPARRSGHGVFDDVRNRFLQVGGVDDVGNIPGDTWAFHGANAEWCQVAICPLMQVYCTAGTTTNGCNASMSASGTPSVGASSGFTLSCSNVEGQKFGLIFYGVCGPKAAPWGPGSTSYLCVKAPVQRTPADNSGGTAGACDGSFSIDFLTYLSTHPSALGQPMNAGQVVTTQCWFRDPPAPGTTNLSDGLQFTTVP